MEEAGEDEVLRGGADDDEDEVEEDDDEEGGVSVDRCRSSIIFSLTSSLFWSKISSRSANLCFHTSFSPPIVVDVDDDVEHGHVTPVEFLSEDEVDADMTLLAIRLAGELFRCRILELRDDSDSPSILSDMLSLQRRLENPFVSVRCTVLVSFSRIPTQSRKS